MTQHPSLRSSIKSKQHRSVLKRFERLKYLKEKEGWQEGMSIFGLPKIKILKFKIKKEKAAAPEEALATTAGQSQEGATGKVSPAGPTAPKTPTPQKGPTQKEEKAKK